MSWSVMSWSGQCLGGPYDGQMLVHWQSTYSIYTPWLEFPIQSHSKIEAILSGTYYHVSGQWIWRANEQAIYRPVPRREQQHTNRS